MDITKLGELLKDATTPERKIEILSLMVDEQRMAIVQKDNLIIQQRNEINSLSGKIELANTFTNSKKDEIIKEQMNQIDNLRHDLKMENVRKTMYFEALTQKTEELKILSAQLKRTQLDLESEQTISKMKSFQESEVAYKTSYESESIMNAKNSVFPKQKMEESSTIDNDSQPIVQNIVNHNYNFYGTYNQFGRLNIKG